MESENAEGTRKHWFEIWRPEFWFPFTHQLCDTGQVTVLRYSVFLSGKWEVGTSKSFLSWIQDSSLISPPLQPPKDTWNGLA